MRKNKGKIISILLIALSVISIGITTYAHSGKTDSSGGHRDNKNKSGLGSYHYHCGGHPAHLHTNGVCPYSSSSSSKSTKTTSSSSKGRTTSSSSSTTSKETKTTTPSTVAVTNIQINENIESIDVGDSKILTATITPDNATDQNITWNSSDDSIATVSSIGKITAKKSGIAEITATSSNGKVSTIRISVKEEIKEEAKEPIKDNTVTSTATIYKNNINNNTTTDTQEDSNVLGGVAAVAILGGVGYWVHRKRNRR
ncbi:MAG: Ig domain-containing protein [Clostridia bacterium]|nr:Ig domain-containing protein [Clostridia bacterium]